jgi:hypothetical protein
VFIDSITFEENGAIRTIVPTLEGPPVHPVALELRAEKLGPYQAGDSLRLEARFLNDQPWERVEFFSHATCIGQTLGGNASWLWQQLSTGFHRLTARAIFASGETATSAPLNIDVF